jgi:hypothetical protein
VQCALFQSAKQGDDGCGNNIVAAVERQQVSVWDVRQQERGGCIRRWGVSFYNKYFLIIKMTLYVTFHLVIIL